MRWLSLVFCTAALWGCSLLTRFDPDTQPCDGDGLCLAGFVCRDGLCVTDDGGVAQGGGAGGGGQCAVSELDCGDGLDDDCDSRVDCLDPDCTGRTCSDGNACSTGETCQASACVGGQPKRCDTPGPCESAAGASCSAATGACVYQPSADGVICGSTASRRCCAGACADLSAEAANCGGCGLACPVGSRCESIAASTCNAGPAATSARCSCGTGLACPALQTCTADGACSPVVTTNCAMGQRIVTVPGCASYCTY